MLYKYGKDTSNFWGRFYFILLYFGCVLNKTIIPLALVGYDMIRANSYPMRAHRIIVNRPFPNYL